jgi:hypothetical protein
MVSSPQPDETIFQKFNDFSSMQLTARRITKNGGQRRQPLASSLPWLSCWLAPPWPGRLMAVCRASAPLPTTARRSPLRLPTPYLLHRARPLDRTAMKIAGKTLLFLGLGVAAVIAFAVMGSAAQAQVRSPTKLPDPRAEFVRQCAPHMMGRWAHPETVCGCLHDHAAAVETPSAAARHQRDRRAHHRDGLGAPGETIRDRRHVYEDRKADLAVHVRAGDLGSPP